MTLPLHHRLAFRFGGLTALLVVVAIGGFAASTWQREHKAVPVRYGELLQHIAGTAAVTIDGDLHQTIRDRADANSDAFREIQRHLRAVQQVNGLREDLLYTIQLQPDGVATAAVMLQAVPYTGDAYQPPPENVALLHQVVATGRPAHSGLYRDNHGEWVSGFAPILDASGRVTGVVEADFDVSAVNAALDRELTALLGLSAFIILTALLALALAYRRMERDLDLIRQGAGAIEAGDYDYRIDLNSKDELGLVAERFNRMAEVLAERFHLLAFIPKHTLDAIALQVQGEAAQPTARVDATVLFSDIRGYTSLSETLSTDALVSILDHLLRLQAETVQAHNGVVDKFIGDAVLAYFTGPNHERDAVAAALDIQAAIAAVPPPPGVTEPVQVGVGLSSGEVLMAEVGANHRRERALLGNTVNLASRLCSWAGGDEVAVCETLRTRLAGTMTIAREAMVELKGVARTQQIAVVTGLSGHADPPAARAMMATPTTTRAQANDAT